MGVTGLLPAVEAVGALDKTTLAEVARAGVTSTAVDSYCLLHRGAFACGPALATGGTSDLYIKYCMKYVNMLLHHSIKPIMVFDGRHLPAKAQTELKRREMRSSAKQKAAELLRMGKTEEARSQLRRCVDITHEMAFGLIKECRNRNVDCIVAPYEADAQLAYLNKIKIADVVVTEDSDLILFGCSKVIFKLDLNGNCALFDHSKLYSVMKCPLEKYSFRKFRQMCILSGCDYLASLPGIGLAKARKFINAIQDPDIHNALKRIPSFLNKSQLVVTDEYRDSFMMAEATFMHQLVYDPLQRKIVPLSDPKEEGTKPEYLFNAGDMISDDVAFDLALGNLDPFTLKRFDNWNPDKILTHVNKSTKLWNKDVIAPHKSVWSKDYSNHNNTLSKNHKSSNINAIFNKPSTKNVVVRVSCPSTNNDEERLTIEDLSSMYVIKEKKNIVIPETQDFEDSDLLHFSKNRQSESITVNNKSLKRSLSPVENKNDKSPILENKNRSYKKLMKSDSFSQLSKISKFQRTVIDKSVLVESRFFSSIETLPSSEESGLNISGISNLKMDDDSVELKTEIQEHNSLKSLESNTFNDENDDTILNRKLTLDGFEWSSYSNNDSTTYKKNIGELKTRNPFKKQNSEFTIDSGFSSSQDILEEVNDILPKILSETPKQIANVIKNDENIKFTQNKDPKVVQACRRPGLSKKKPTIQAGQKLLTTFGFQKKSQLKH